ncbi:transcription initiation factor IIB isoform X1 [Hyalella azteca]|uniref:Transcription initiation factor IIB n=1 Tax=Hyalella azteca TaxID=294128 RepID=A0A8B7N8U7_HYAAZ|nr:transcription initiation factor IIB isoform X1 [Hyalella azteca]
MSKCENRLVSPDAAQNAKKLSRKRKRSDFTIEIEPKIKVELDHLMFDDIKVEHDHFCEEEFKTEQEYSGTHLPEWKIDVTKKSTESTTLLCGRNSAGQTFSNTSPDAESSSVDNQVVKNEPTEIAEERIMYDNTCTVGNIKMEQSEDGCEAQQMNELIEDRLTSDSKISVEKKKNCTIPKCMMQSFKFVSDLVRNINASESIIDDAMCLLIKVRMSITSGRSSELMSGACVYIACRQAGDPRSFNEIAALCNFSKKDLGRAFKTVMKIIDSPLDIIKSDDFVSRYGHSLGIGQNVIEAAIHIANEAQKLDIIRGRSPISVAAGAIYMATQARAEALTLLEVSQATGTSENTVNIIYRALYPYAKQLFPANFEFDHSVENFPSRDRQHYILWKS